MHLYTGKAMKGLIALARVGAFEGERVVFLHTGGAQGLFGYRASWSRCSATDASRRQTGGGMGDVVRADPWGCPR